MHQIIMEGGLCVCKRERKREGDKERERERERERETIFCEAHYNLVLMLQFRHCVFLQKEF